MNFERSRSILGIAAVLISSVCLSCSATGAGRPPAPLSAITDSSAHSKTRIRAINRSWDAHRAGEVDVETLRESLKKVVWSRSTFWEIRLAALEALLADTPRLDDTKNMIRLMLPTETHWEIMEFVADTASEGGWRYLGPALVRSWARPPVVEPSDADRPERRALGALYPEQSVEETVYKVFAAQLTDAPSKEKDRLAAWGLLCRIDPSATATRTLLAGDASHTDDEMLGVLRRCASELKSVPQSDEQLRWLLSLAGEENSAFWDNAELAIAGLSTEQLEGFELRHAAAVVWANEYSSAWLTLDRGALLDEFESRQSRMHTHQRDRSSNADVVRPATVQERRDELVWGDALTALIASEFVAESSLHETLVYYADRDQADKSTEYGGVIGFDSGARFTLKEFPPRPAQRIADNRFIASIDMFDASSTALFHFHMHVQRYRNATYAGPSAGDIDYAKLQGRSCLLFSFTDKQTLNVDYYQGNGANLDLGEIRRPVSE